MAVNLTRNAEQVNFDTDASYGPMLAKLQANILWSHGRDHARHLFIRFTGDRAAVRAWIRNKVAPDVTSAAQQRQQKLARDQANPEDGDFDGGLVTGFFLSADGYTFLELDPAQFDSTGFLKGMKDRSNYRGPLGLRLTNHDPESTEWEPGYRGDIHALVTLADDKVGGNLSRLETKVELYKSQIDNGLGVVTQIEKGQNLKKPIPGHPGKSEPVEHFGYFDGISQPLFTKPDLIKYDQEQERVRLPDDWNPGAKLKLILAKDPFAAAEDSFGSFFVYRKLEQDYATFKQRVAALATAIPATEELAGAYVVGRFKDGSPVTAAQTPSPGLVTANFFKYSDDEAGRKCPMQAHIRKSNPRGTSGVTLASERARRIARRAIPYGNPHPDLECNPEHFQSQEGGPRGLLFMCFQSNIEKQFEFIQRVWIDNKDFPRGTGGVDTGDDPLIGQNPGAAQRWPKRWGSLGAQTREFNFEAAVTLKGGEYFFAPSLPFLASL